MIPDTNMPTLFINEPCFVCVVCLWGRSPRLRTFLSERSCPSRLKFGTIINPYCRLDCHDVVLFTLQQSFYPSTSSKSDVCADSTSTTIIRVRGLHARSALICFEAETPHRKCRQMQANKCRKETVGMQINEARKLSEANEVM